MHYLVILAFNLSMIFGYSVHFEVDMTDLEFPNADYDQCGVNGSWNDWSGWGLVLTDSDQDGIYTGTLPNMNNGTYQYVFFCSGPADNWSGWGITINSPMGASCDWIPNDEWANYGFQIQGSDISQSYCAGSCDSDCGDSDGGDDGGGDQTYSLVWSDEFNESDIDESNWNFEIGNGDWGWGNGEHQYYREENAFIEDGKLIIEALNESYGGFNYTSSRMQTRNKADFLYGKVVASIKVPGAGGTWPAFWMMPTNSVYGGWPHSGEIDIMEHYGCNPGDVHATVHNNTYNWNGGIPPTSYSMNTSATSEFHEYEVEWTEDELKFFVDGSWIGSYYNQNSGWQQWPYDQEFYIILNLAIGSHFMPCETQDQFFPERYEIDYVRVYQLTDEFQVDLYGDVNQDGNLDVLDIVLILGFILDTSQPTDIDFLISDANQDGALDILDIVLLISQILE